MVILKFDIAYDSLTKLKNGVSFRSDRTKKANHVNQCLWIKVNVFVYTYEQLLKSVLLGW